MDIDIDYKKGILFIRIIGNFIRSNISKFEERIIPIILELTAKKVSINLSNIVNRFNGKVAICDINNDVNNYIKSSDVFDYCFKSKNEESVVGVLNI